MDDLIKRLEALDGPDREADEAMIVARLRAVTESEGKGYCDAVTDVYATLPVGQFYRDITAMIQAAGEGHE